MRIHINIETGNSAFEPHAGAEVARLLRTLADKMEEWDETAFRSPLFDVNGNKVGTAQAG